MTQTFHNGRYELIDTLGKGGMGAVYLCRDTKIANRHVAIKENFGKGIGSEEQFKHEAGILAQLYHATLPAVMDYFVEPRGRQQYIVMEYVEGMDLKQVLRTIGEPLPEGDVLLWADEIMKSLIYLHTWRNPHTGQITPITHRDIKPANLRLTPKGQIMLVDFGIAKIEMGQGQTLIGASAISKGYSPLEQYSSGEQGSQTDERSDIYSLGATLYHLLTNTASPPAIERASGTPLESPRKLNRKISTSTEKVILKAMELQFQKRFVSVVEMRKALLSPNTSQKAMREAKANPFRLPTVGDGASGGHTGKGIQGSPDSWSHDKRGNGQASGSSSRQAGSRQASTLSRQTGTRSSVPKHVLNNGRYELVKRLGKGGMGAVYLAYDRRLSNRLVAIKENISYFQGSNAQFMREANILAQLSHPNLPSVIDYFVESHTANRGEAVTDEHQYLVMEYVEGQDLKHLLRQRGSAIPEAHVLLWAEQICDALSYLHKWRDPQSHRITPIIHHDIKPANLRLTESGRIMLVDFGIAKLGSTAISGYGDTYMAANAVSRGYSPIEQYSGKDAQTDQRSDIYSLGATLYSLLTFTIPPDTTKRAGGTPLKLPRTINKNISSATDKVILRAMQIQAAKRYQHVDHMRKDLLNNRNAKSLLSKAKRNPLGVLNEPPSVHGSGTGLETTSRYTTGGRTKGGETGGGTTLLQGSIRWRLSTTEAMMGLFSFISIFALIWFILGLNNQPSVDPNVDVTATPLLTEPSPTIEQATHYANGSDGGDNSVGSNNASMLELTGTSESTSTPEPTDTLEPMFTFTPTSNTTDRGGRINRDASSILIHATSTLTPTPTQMLTVIQTPPPTQTLTVIHTPSSTSTSLFRGSFFE
ncbi:MAG: protein kinase [Chloroflexota bacterium]